MSRICLSASSAVTSLLLSSLLHAAYDHPHRASAPDRAASARTPFSQIPPMQARFVRPLSLALAALIGACAEPTSTATQLMAVPLRSGALAVPAVRFAELHYDNVGTDAGEAIEISGPTGTDLTGWSVVLYNGSNGAAYTTTPLSGVIVDACGGRGVTVINYPVNGIQNGSPDGMALVDAQGGVVEFLSYEGVMTAVGGPADGLTSTDIGVSEAGTEPLGQSLARAADGSWSGPATSTYGSCNDNGITPPPPPVASITIAPNGATIVEGGTQHFTATAFDAGNAPIPGTPFTWSSDNALAATVNSSSGLVTAVAAGTANISAATANGTSASVLVTVTAAPPPSGLPDTRFAEIHYDNFGTDQGEAIEVEGPAGTDLTGWSVVLYNGNGGAAYNTSPLSGTIVDACSGRGVVVVNYSSNGIQNGNPDGMALVDGSGQVVEFLSYGGTFAATDGPALGKVSVDIGVVETGAPVGQSLQRDASGVWQQPATSSFGACNGSGSGNPPGNSISFSGRTSADPALPVGYEDQLFATVRDGNGNTIPTTVTWTSETPSIVSIDANGVLYALSVGTFVVRATAADGVTTATYSLDTQIATPGGTAQYGNNTEFGVPADNDPSDDILVSRAEYTTSWSPLRGTPNWVSYDLDATHIGNQDRCDCFTFDPALPASLPRYTTADYTGAGAYAGYGIDRGHLARSFDFSTGLLDNAHSFLFSNIIPQAADNNQGPWAALENFIGDEARFQNKEAYIIAGVAGNKGTVKGEGKIVIPAYTWKVAVLMGRDQGLQDVHGVGDLTVVAVVMPNEPGIRNVPWQTFEVTVDSVEALSGYDLLALLPDQIENAIESGSSPPVAATDGPYTSAEGSPVAMSGAGSSDPDNDPLTYAWNFGDGTTGTGATTSHTYVQDGTYTVQLTVTDSHGLATTATTTATVTNVVPVIAALPTATLITGEPYAVNGSFTDPGQDPWTGTVDYGDGVAASPLTIAGQTFSLSHAYARAGNYTVTVAISDGVASDSRSVTITVLNNREAIASAIAQLQAVFSAGRIPPNVHGPLNGFLTGALATAQTGQIANTLRQLDKFLTRLDAFESAGQFPSADAAVLRAFVLRIVASIQAS